ncbi:RNA polymerase sigma-54 factor [Bordetella ansorpii]|uniref:RNA polymerase sigma-54 factor n=2 Tax=Bordetella ansorpii TaxID=288768 RepID=A0A157SX09_9BORD|nr:RNA polymerase factor sigma-54 [Bordetella ansorpii]SAI74871.1 RNA polymerase sigma-54 factor [Bordetella ansorpii]
MAHAAQELRMRQQTLLAPRLQQSIRLLQMSALEFTTAVQDALATNPFLEDGEDAEHGNGAASAQDGQETASEDGAAAPAPEAAPEPQADFADSPLPQAEGSAYSGDYPTHVRNDAGPAADLSQWIAAPVSLRQRLSGELGNYPLTVRDRLLAEFIVDALDEDGYLHTSMEELAGSAAFDPAPDAAEWAAALKLVQQLDVPGLGARDLTECLSLQLYARDDVPGDIRDAALGIVRGNLDRLARNDIAGLQRALGVDADTVQCACELVRTLDPKPGRQYASDAPNYVVPDVIVSKVRGRWQVVANRQSMPQARLNRTYADLFHRARMDERSPMAQELQEARWLVRNVEQRYITIRRVAEAIVRRQQTFFEYGDVALRPLMLRDVADELEMHESTVSRATANKYMITPRGLFEFRHFFSRELSTDTGGSCSAAAVRALIKEYIDEEDPRTPLSDVVLAQRLASNGVVVARRTVSKYRIQMKVPPAEMRRQG